MIVILQKEEEKEVGKYIKLRSLVLYYPSGDRANKMLVNSNMLG